MYLASFENNTTYHTHTHTHTHTHIHSLASGCDPLPDPANGRVTISGTTVGSAASYSCNKGFQLEAGPTRICQPDGTWSGTEPFCRGDEAFFSSQLCVCLKSQCIYVGVKVGLGFWVRVRVRLRVRLRLRLRVRVRVRVKVRVMGRIKVKNRLGSVVVDGVLSLRQ